MSSLGLLDQKEEDTIHKSRLLNVEVKPFQRVSKKLVGETSPFIPSSKFANGLPSPAVEGEGDTPSTREELLSKFRDDVLLDFSNFDAAIIRIQHLCTANSTERLRYTQKKARIIDTSSSVRLSNTTLRSSLTTAQQTLALRKTYDALAEKITSNRLLRTREDQEANLRKLEKEIEDLERESGEYRKTWGERRAQFERIVEEGMGLRRLIRDEKEEVERREGMAEGGVGGGEDGDGAEDGEVAGSPDGGSGTPLPQGSEAGGDTGELPSSSSGGNSLTVKDGLRKRNGRDQSPSGLSTTSRGSHVEHSQAGGDTAMADNDDDDEDEGMIEEGDSIDNKKSDAEAGAEGEREEGEEIEEPAEKMDIT